jgi:hypothetical protein
VSWTAERARHAALRRHHPDHPELAAAARLQLKVIRAEDYIRGLVASEPALTGQQREDLAIALLRDPGPGGGNVTA